ncbi:hypothetical protein EO087_10725 [Dyella sp. M7H15-1]|uniref:hypothetical protein n=1 Tax=Dyella sp. M7H15-1 TaxID=2501295 RepID=UPI001004F306|nr:hypothetical protein [Dyella sp. M7H15-1]QAU24406.1 hypothetical protein EO087_10725 [Dyella sp. M7H15-1]
MLRLSIARVIVEQSSHSEKVAHQALFGLLSSKPSESLRLSDLFKENKIVILGENHYDKDHYEWIIENMADLKGVSVMMESVHKDTKDISKAIYGKCFSGSYARLECKLLENDIRIVGLECQKSAELYSEVNQLAIDLKILEGQGSNKLEDRLNIFAEHIGELMPHIEKEMEHVDDNDPEQLEYYKKCDSQFKDLLSEFVSSSGVERSNLIDMRFLNRLNMEIVTHTKRHIPMRYEVNESFAESIRSEFEENNKPILVLTGAHHIYDYPSEKCGILSRLTDLPAVGINVNPDVETIQYKSFTGSFEINGKSYSKESSNVIIQAPPDTFLDSDKRKLYERDDRMKKENPKYHPMFDPERINLLHIQHKERTDEMKKSTQRYIDSQKNNQSFCTIS